MSRDYEKIGQAELIAEEHVDNWGPARTSGVSFWRGKRVVMVALAAVGLVLVVTAIAYTASTSDADIDNEDMGPGHQTHIDRVPPGSYKLTGTDVYCSGDADPLIVLLPDINGMSTEVKAIADFYAKGGFTAVVIDYFNGDPRNISDPTWNDRHPANKSLALAVSVVEDLLQRGYRSIQAQGYCYGGRTGVSLASTKLVRGAVVAHPSSLVKDDASLVIQPMFFVMPAIDTFNALAPFFNETLASRGIPAEFKIYPNSTHGFAVSSTTNPFQKARAMNDSLSWFHEHKFSNL